MTDKPWIKMFPCYEEANWSYLPPHMHDSVKRYVEHGTPHMGSFLHAIMRKGPWNEVLARADTDNQATLRGWAIFCTMYLPAACWGSDKAIENWVELGGMKGIYDTEKSADTYSAT